MHMPPQSCLNLSTETVRFCGISRCRQEGTLTISVFDNYGQRAGHFIAGCRIRHDILKAEYQYGDIFME